jgi:ABC-type uncharacterized transport system substrate-binding protein
MRSGLRAAGLPILVLLGLAIARTATAHPHVFVDYGVKLVFDERDIRAARMSWTFDEMYSAMLFNDFTSRPHGGLTAADVRNLKANAFDPAVDHQFFVEIRINGQPIPVTAVTEFEARFQQHRMTYAFTLPLRTATPVARNSLEIGAFDTEFYIDFELLKKDPITIEHGAALAVACSRKPLGRDTTGVGPVESQIVTCSYGPAS